jgi:hypothetical protein
VDAPGFLRTRKEIFVIVRGMIEPAEEYETSYINCELYVKVLFVSRQDENQHISHQDRT